MIVEHRLQFDGQCPVDGATDSYDCLICVRRTLPVEQILAAVSDVTSEPIFQEDITRLLAERLRADVVTRCWHSGVDTTCGCLG